jgi:hypothetical protein
MLSPAIRQALVCVLFAFTACRHHQLQKSDDHFLEDPRMDETSGIAASATNPGLYYAHNDSGDSSRFFAITPDGHLQAIYYFNGDPSIALGVRDCEDIADGPGPDNGASYVYLGDIGDNNAKRKYITVYRIKEPVLHFPTPVALIDHLDVEPLVLHYPDGPRDSETLMIDPVDKLIYIVSKREDSVHVYSTPLNFRPHDTVVLTRNTNLHFSGSNKWITAGDISRKGDQILLKSYRKVYYWTRQGGEPVWKTIQRTPTILPYIVEPQGEAIGFNLEGTGYYTVSEGVKPELYHYSVPGR